MGSYGDDAAPVDRTQLHLDERNWSRHDDEHNVIRCEEQAWKKVGNELHKEMVGQIWLDVHHTNKAWKSNE